PVVPAWFPVRCCSSDCRYAYAFEDAPIEDTDIASSGLEDKNRPARIKARGGPPEETPPKALQTLTLADGRSLAVPPPRQIRTGSAESVGGGNWRAAGCGQGGSGERAASREWEVEARGLECARRCDGSGRGGAAPSSRAIRLLEKLQLGFAEPDEI